MSDTGQIQFVKPSLTNLPPEIGIPIFDQIMNAPKARTEELDQLVAELRERILRESEYEEKLKNECFFLRSDPRLIGSG